MPFIELKQPSDFIRIKSDGTIRISKSLLRHFKKFRCVKVFHDNEKKLVGLQPNNKGYKLTLSNGTYGIKCTPLSKIIQGEFYPQWSDEHQMLIFSYNRNL